MYVKAASVRKAGGKNGVPSLLKKDGPFRPSVP